MPHLFFVFFNPTRLEMTRGVSVHLLADGPEQAIPVRLHIDRCGAGRELPVPGSQPASDGDAERHLEASAVEKEKEKQGIAFGEYE